MSIKKKVASMVLVALAVAVMAPQAMAVTPEVHPVEGGFPLKAAGLGSGASLTTASTTISCTSGTGEGQATNETTAEGSAVLHGCTGPLGAACTTAGQPAGTIVIATSIAHLVYLDEAHTKVGSLTTPPASGVFAKFTCLGIVVEVKGNGLLSEITAPKCGEKSKTGTTVATSTSPGVQKYTQIEETGTVYKLESKTGGGEFVAASLDGTVTGTPEREFFLTCPGQHE